LVGGGMGSWGFAILEAVERTADAPPEQPPPLSGLAMAAYALGLTPLGVLSLPLGLWAWRRIATSHQSGKPVAASAIALGTIWCAGFALLLSIFFGKNTLHFEQAAVSELELLWSGQLRFRQAAVVDQDGDTRGEFALFAELGAGGIGRTHGGTRPIPTGDAHGSWASHLFGTPDASGVVRKYRYCFKCFLPGAGTQVLGHGATLPPGDRAAADAQEQRFLIYAWPEVHGDSAVRAFLLDGRTGTIWHCSNGTDKAGRYSGLERQPLPGSAFHTLGDPARWPAAMASPGRTDAGLPHDGEDWAPLSQAGN